MTWHASAMGRVLIAFYRYASMGWHEFRFHWALLARTSRLFLVSAGFPLQRDRDPNKEGISCQSLPQALLDTDTSLEISIHGDGSISPRYQDKISSSLKLARQWQREYGIDVTSVSYATWIRGYHGFRNEIMPFEDNNPRKSWDNCITGQECFQLYEDCLWKCAPLAYLRLQDRKFNLSEKWKPYLNYEPLKPECTDEELAGFFNRKAEAVCGMCPSKPQQFTKKDPLLPVRFYRKT